VMWIRFDRRNINFNPHLYITSAHNFCAGFSSIEYLFYSCIICAQLLAQSVFVNFPTTYTYQYDRYNLPVDDLEVHCCVPHPLKIIAT